MIDVEHDSKPRYTVLASIEKAYIFFSFKRYGGRICIRAGVWLYMFILTFPMIKMYVHGS